MSQFFMSWGQFNETKLCVNYPEVEQNLLLMIKTRRNFQLKLREISAGQNFMLNIGLMKLAPGVGDSVK